MGTRHPRLDLVLQRRQDLLDVARAFDACLSLTGSVARGEEAERDERPGKPRESDIDFYVSRFTSSGDHSMDYDRANQLVRRVRQILAPYAVDLRPLPGWLIDDPQLEGFKRDAVPLEELPAASL
ncbi:MAG: hypothetical protein QOD07_2095 [Frankiaceae bacterium]|nr:hypothetical protein [Frankiaceae bacterium]